MSESPYKLLNSNDGIQMMEEQCEHCELYQPSRPSCRILQDYFKGRYIGIKAPKEWVKINETEAKCKVLVPVKTTEVPNICTFGKVKPALKTPEYISGTTEEERTLKTICVHNQ